MRSKLQCGFTAAKFIISRSIYELFTQVLKGISQYAYIYKLYSYLYLCIYIHVYYMCVCVQYGHVNTKLLEDMTYYTAC